MVSLLLAKDMIDKANLLLRFAALAKAPTLDKCVKATKPRKPSARMAPSHDLLKRVGFILLMWPNYQILQLLHAQIIELSKLRSANTRIFGL